VTHALLLDFPWNRVMPGRVHTVHLLSPAQVYALQVVLLLVGLCWSLDAMQRNSERLFADREARAASFVPMAGLAVVLTLASLWTLGTGLP
jgi:hypothetical protein